MKKRTPQKDTINYETIIAAIEALISRKRTELDNTPIFLPQASVLWEDVRFWERRLEALREKERK